MAANAKETLIKRIAGTPGRGTGANTGLGTTDVIVPEFPQLPGRLTEESIRQFKQDMDRWRASLQAQFPVPTSQAQSTTVDPTDKITAAVDAAVATINKQIESINSIISSKFDTLQTQIDNIESNGVSTSDVQSLINSARYIHTQGSASAVWRINHNLGWYPSVTAVDMSQNVFFGDVRYIDTNTCELVLFGETSGYAYLN